MMRPDALVLLMILVLMAACSDHRQDDVQVPEQVTFNEHVAPIIFENCATCHRPGESAPFDLLTYNDVRRRARQIADVTESRFMPPWLPAPDHTDFQGQRRLTDTQIATLGRWAQQGAPQGDPANLPPLPVFTEGWQLGEPDLIVQLPEPYTLSAEGFDVFRNFVIPLPVQQRKYVAAVELRPGNPRVVHHAVMFTDRTQSSRRQDAQDQTPGFPGMDVASAVNPDGHFLGWTPGKIPLGPIEGLAWRLDPGTDMVLQLHMLPSGKPEVIQPTVGLYFSDEPPTDHLYHVSLHNDFIDIPAGEQQYTLSNAYTLPVDVDVVSIYPHAHYIAKQMKGWAQLPDGTHRWLLDIPDWDFNWQDQYRYQEPIFLPKGTTLHMEYVYDNSADNPRNPHVPPRRVTFGLESTDEMGRLGVQVMPRDGMEALTILRQDKADHDLREDIAEVRRMADAIGDQPQAHVTLGRALRRAGDLNEAQTSLVRALQSAPQRADVQLEMGLLRHQQGRHDEAIVYLTEALRIDPEFIEARYGLGNTLMAQGQLEEAMAVYDTVLGARPDHISALYNLGVALQRLGRLEQAIERYGQVLGYDPDHANAHYNLGIAHGSSGRALQAAEHFQQAVQLQPNWAEAHNNLGTALQALGQRDEAIAHFRRAVQLRPDYASARRNLQRASGG